MKQAFLKFFGKKFFSAALLSTSILLSSFTAGAAVHPSNIEILSGDKSSVQFAGSTGDALLFKVNINNEKSDAFTVTIKNENGDLLFSKSFSEANFQKQFKLLKGEQDGDRYYLSITSDNKNLEETYVISASTRMVDDVEINKL